MTATMTDSAAVPRLDEDRAGIPMSGVVDIGEGHAFVRTSGYRRSAADVYVSAGQIRQYGLRSGDMIEGTARPDGTGRGKFRPLARVDTVNGIPPEAAKRQGPGKVVN